MTTLTRTLINRPSFTVQHLFVVDTTSHNSQSKSLLISQVNDSLDAIRQSSAKHSHQHHRITVMLVSSDCLRCNCHDLAIEDIHDFRFDEHCSNQSSKILDGIGGSIATWRALSHRRRKADKYQVTIFSQVHDQQSTKYTCRTLKAIITSLTQVGWIFTLIGSTPLLSRIATNLGINNYYVCKSTASCRERNFIISHLRRQWRKQHLGRYDVPQSQVAA